MAIRDKLASIGRIAANATVDVFSELVKADNQTTEVDDEGQARTPGGNKQDTSENAPLPTEPTKQDPKTMFFDPFALVEQMGYKERPSRIAYNTIRRSLVRMPLCQAVIKTRINQIAAFSLPQRDRYQMGFRLKLRDSEEKPSEADKKWIKQAETMILRTGITNNPRGREDFETFLRKVCMDSYYFDALCFEVVPNRKGIPTEWYAVDASTIRLADTSKVFYDEDATEEIRTVQIYDGMIVSEYNQSEMCYAVQNPRTDIRSNGYGVSVVEEGLKTITALLNSSTYNEKFFTQNSIPKGLLNIKGSIGEPQLNAFKRHFYQMIKGVKNSWKAPITNAEEIQWINMLTSNRDMEFNAWMDFQIKVWCALMAMNPAEINFQYGNTGQRSAMSETNNREKITESKERGLRPMLRFVANQLNKYVIWPINENFEFEFVGLDAATRDSMAELNSKRVKTTWTVDELRAEEDKPPLPDGKGECILDPTWMQFASMKDQPAMGEGEEGMESEGDEGGEGEIDFEALLQEQLGEESGEEEKISEEKTQEKIPVEKSMRSTPHIIDLTI